MIAENPLLEITRSRDHRYRYRGTWVPGVSMILKVLGATFNQAANYGAKHAAYAAVDLVDELPKMIETVGRDGAVNAIKEAGNKYRNEKADLGTEIHALADLVVRGLPTPSMSEVTRTRVLAYAEWWRASQWRLRSSESMLINTEMQYGGTLDLLAYDATGKTVLADIKTGALYKEAVLQLTAYGAATLIQTATGLYAMPKIDRYVLLHVTEDGVRESEINVGALERLAWAACRDLHDWSESMKGKKL